ncbi:hypothetical protein E2986_06938 [Frieseomelitta varia]|uniref:Ig-like domain-containing protein n=1 Tax=Frieseomelitta varia TaxID=561572 RepID=A0A833VS59_9HYME|nr:hypothetical protein E2986_06938 [Frieseomelitta varia]
MTSSTGQKYLITLYFAFLALSECICYAFRMIICIKSFEFSSCNFASRCELKNQSVVEHSERRLNKSYNRQKSVHGLKDISIDIPLAVAAGTTVNMSCGYDLESDTLYVMKWYYKGSEFFRFVPKEMPPTSTFGELGNKVILNKSDAHRVVLRDLQPNYTGKYLCEVSGDSPSFTTLVDVGYMHVANLPKGDPQVRFEKIRYAVGDTVRGNCTVPSGNPPANVTWTVNGIPVNSSFIMNVTDKLGDNQQLMSIAGLDFEIIPDSFNNGRLHIVCNANVFHLYKKQADVSLMEERPRLASVLGTRESSYIDP